MALTISELYIYPIKSLGGISLLSSAVDVRGLLYDRRWMLINQLGKGLTQRDASVMATLKLQATPSGFEVFPLDNPNDKINIPFIPSAETEYYPRIPVCIWDDQCEGLVYPDDINQWFTQKIGIDCRLVFMDDQVKRMVDPRFAQGGEITSYSDGYPALLLGQRSMDDLNRRMGTTLPINRFRANIIFTGGYPNQEDDIKSFFINGIHFSGVKPCARCNVPTIDQDTGKNNTEPTATLATYRLSDKKILFGQNVLIHQSGKISVGDELVIG